MPVVFIGHGSPTNVLEDNKATQSWRKIAVSMPEPKSILCISAHWLTRGSAVTGMDTPRTIHDFGRSLPAALFDCHYPAPGRPELASRTADLLSPTDVTIDQDWGLDHGAWSVLCKAWPDADIPVVQLSLDVHLSDREHFDLGRRLRSLRDEGVLILGSGNIVHNLGVMQWDEEAEPYAWATRFREYINGCIDDDDMERLFAYAETGEDARNSLPGMDHFWPLFYVLGARDGDAAEFHTDFVQYKSLSMTSVVFRGARR
jgi:4,5-DOPA dioxygenase extradiol